MVTSGILFAGKGELSSALPLFAILTLAATGSEMNPYAVVTNEETHENYRSVTTIHDRWYPYWVRRWWRALPRLPVYSAADIISHLIEVYFTATVQPKNSVAIGWSTAKYGNWNHTNTHLKSGGWGYAWNLHRRQPGSKRFDPVRLCRIQLSESCNRALFIRTFSTFHTGQGCPLLCPFGWNGTKTKYTAVWAFLQNMCFGLSSADDGIAARRSGSKKLVRQHVLNSWTSGKQICPLSLRTSRSMSKRLVSPVITRRKL